MVLDTTSTAAMDQTETELQQFGLSGRSDAQLSLTALLQNKSPAVEGVFRPLLSYKDTYHTVKILTVLHTENVTQEEV